MLLNHKVMSTAYKALHDPISKSLSSSHSPAHYIQNTLTQQHYSLSGEHLLIITFITVIHPQIK